MFHKMNPVIKLLQRGKYLKMYNNLKITWVSETCMNDQDGQDPQSNRYHDRCVTANSSHDNALVNSSQ